MDLLSVYLAKSTFKYLFYFSDLSLSDAEEDLATADDDEHNDEHNDDDDDDDDELDEQYFTENYVSPSLSLNDIKRAESRIGSDDVSSDNKKAGDVTKGKNSSGTPTAYNPVTTTTLATVDFSEAILTVDSLDSLLGSVFCPKK